MRACSSSVPFQPRSDFGAAVAISGPRAIVTTYLKKDENGNVGRGAAAYVFEETASGWKQVDKLTPGPAGATGAFGSDVAISGAVAVIGANGDSERGLFAGAAYVFVRNSHPPNPRKWALVDKVFAAGASDFANRRGVFLPGGLLATADANQ